MVHRFPWSASWGLLHHMGSACSNDWVRALNTGLRFQAIGFNCLCLSVSDCFMCWDWLVGVGYGMNVVRLYSTCMESSRTARTWTCVSGPGVIGPLFFLQVSL